MNAKLTVSAELHQIVVPPSSVVNAAYPFWIQDSPDASLVFVSVASNDFWDTAANISKTQMPAPAIVTVKSISVNIGTALGSGPLIFTLSVNGSDTAVTCTINTGQTVGFSSGFSLALALSDKLALHASGAGLPSAPLIRGGVLGLSVAA